jgi:hypothetical protein
VRALDQEDWPESPNLLRVDSEEEDTPQSPSPLRKDSSEEDPRSPSLLAEWYSQVPYRTLPYRTGTYIDVGRVANCNFLFGQLGTSTVVRSYYQENAEDD